MSIGGGGRYSCSLRAVPSLLINGLSREAPLARFEWQEWQVNLGVSYRIKLLTPYIGVNYRQEKTSLIEFPFPIGQNELRNRIPWGLYLGCTVSNGHFLFLNLEGQIFDEEAFTLSVDFRL